MKCVANVDSAREDFLFLLLEREMLLPTFMAS